MRHCYQHLWQNQWETIDKGRFLFQIHPYITRLINLSGFCRKDERLLQQMRMEKCKLNFFQIQH